MNEERWWLVPGVIVEIKYELYEVYESASIDLDVKITKRVCAWYGDKLYNRKYKLRVTPFDCMPEWVKEISFRLDGWYSWNREALHHCFNNCPKEWRGKTFPITNELKKLIGIIGV